MVRKQSSACNLEFNGDVIIRRKGGQAFTLKSVELSNSPLDVGYIETDITRDDILTAIRDSR